MIIQCDKCKRKFKIDDSRITPPGSKVRCSKCGHVSFVEKKEISGADDPIENGKEGLPSVNRAGGPDRGVSAAETRDTGQFSSAPKQAEIEERGEIIGEEVSDTVHGFEFRYPINNEGTNKPGGADTPNGRSYENKGDSGAGSLTGDEGNWEEFVNISKTEKGADEFRIKDNRDIRRQESGFNWDSLRINDEPAEAVRTIPRMFEDEGVKGDGLIILKDEGIPDQAETNALSREERSKERVYPRTAPEHLSVDMDVLSGSPHAASGYHAGQRPSVHDSFRMHPARYKSKSGVFTRAAYGLLTVLVFVVIITAAYIISLNSGIIPKETADKVERLVESLVPVGLTGHSKDEVRVTAHSGKWLDTRNGPMYVISGAVTNESARPVNFIKIKSEFISEGQTVYDNVVYAGNTFTENELKASLLSDTLLKLKKKSGNIDFYNPEKLAGLNTNIEPGESIPFYSVFPASGRVLGLKYNLEVVDYEDSL